MTKVDVYFDFRSPYAYFASHRIRRGFSGSDINWAWRPVSIDVLLNLQAGREAFASYVDPLSGPKRAHLIADVRRLASYYDLPMRPTKPRRPNSIPALCLACLLNEDQRAPFIYAAFDALWQEQQDISEAEVLTRCLTKSGSRPDLTTHAFATAARNELAEHSATAYAHGVFGVPTFACSDDIFFGNDRLDLLLWAAGKRASSKSP